MANHHLIHLADMELSRLSMYEDEKEEAPELHPAANDRAVGGSGNGVIVSPIDDE